MLLAVAFLPACARQDDAALPKDLDRSPTLQGVDTNANGVRDDIERYVGERFGDAQQQKAMFQNARALQKALLVPPGDVAQAKAVNVELVRATHCIYSAFPADSGGVTASRVGRELEALTTNTRQRLEAYLAFSKTLDGTSWSAPKGGTCE